MFATNLKDLLLAAPAGARTTLGLDPGFRTGVKVAVVDGTGKVVDTCAIYPHQPQRQWDSAKATLAALVSRHGVGLIAVGNGTGIAGDRRVGGRAHRRHPGGRSRCARQGDGE